MTSAYNQLLSALVNEDVASFNDCHYINKEKQPEPGFLAFSAEKMFILKEKLDEIETYIYYSQMEMMYFDEKTPFLMLITLNIDHEIFGDKVYIQSENRIQIRDNLQTCYKSMGMIHSLRSKMLPFYKMKFP